jgi:hypothetical protein
MSNIFASVWVGNRNDVWIDDVVINKCHNCKSEFGVLFNKKHHCRVCGNIFCWKCINNYVEIPNYMISRAKEPPSLKFYCSIIYNNYIMGNVEEKVCDECYQHVNKIITNKKKLENLFKSKQTIIQIKNNSNIADNIKEIYFETFRNIQYVLPNHKYTQIEKDVLLANSDLLFGHSKYIVNLIKSIDWQKFSNAGNEGSEISRQLTSFVKDLLLTVPETKIDCKQLYCTRTCCESLSCDDYINILYSCAEYLPSELFAVIFNIFDLTPENILVCFVPFFANLITHKTVSILLLKNIADLFKRSQMLINNLFWYLFYLKSHVNQQGIQNINNFTRLFDSENIESISTTYEYFYQLTKNVHNLKGYLEQNSRIFPLVYPSNPEIIIEKCLIDKTHITQKGIIKIPYQTNNEIIMMIIKNEDIAGDLVCMNLIQISDVILTDTLKKQIPFQSIIYDVIPITSSYGMIKIVNNAETIYDIKEKQKKSISQYILGTNDDVYVGDLLDTYMESAVLYTLHSFFLGLGDRHLQNIMITSDGKIFHIDFSDILGTNSYPGTCCDVRLDILDVIGCDNCDRYKIYRGMCSDGLIILRKHMHTFFILFDQIPNMTNTAENFVLSRFQPKQHDNDVTNQLMTIISKSSQSYMSYLRDMVHYHSQERTIQGSIELFIKNSH